MRGGGNPTPTQNGYACRRERLLLEWIKQSCAPGYIIPSRHTVYPVDAGPPSQERVNIDAIMNIRRNVNRTGSAMMQELKSPEFAQGDESVKNPQSSAGVVARENLKEYINTFFSGKKEQTPRQATCKDKPGTTVRSNPIEIEIERDGPVGLRSWQYCCHMAGAQSWPILARKTSSFGDNGKFN